MILCHGGRWWNQNIFSGFLYHPTTLLEPIFLSENFGKIGGTLLHTEGIVESFISSTVCSILLDKFYRFVDSVLYLHIGHRHHKSYSTDQSSLKGIYFFVSAWNKCDHANKGAKNNIKVLFNAEAVKSNLKWFVAQLFIVLS